MNKMFFLSGLPRSGSTVLAAILNQRRDIKVTPTSGLISIFGSVVQAWENDPSRVAQGQGKEHLYFMLRSLIPTPPGVIHVDKSRGWVDPTIQKTMEAVLDGPPRIIATVRNVASCAASFVALAKPDNIAEFLRGGYIQHLKGSYMSLRAGYEAYPENILFVEYENLVANPMAEMKRIEEFWGLPRFKYNFKKIDGSSVKEDDENAWGLPGLHDISPTLKSSSLNAVELLGEEYYKFMAPAFWNGESESKTDILDTQVSMAIAGKFEEAEELCTAIHKLRPNDDRAAFNRGWYELRNGRLKSGFELLDRGRLENVFGNPCPSSRPRYDGRLLNGETVLLVLEGGLGDQIHSARWAREIVAKGGVCVVSCSADLAELMLLVDGVSAAVESRAAGGVFHHFHILGMSGYLSFLAIDSAPYIPCRTLPDRNRIGLRWAGNPQFEHEQHRAFDPTPLFSLPGTLVNLQRDEGAELAPEHLLKVPLDTWMHTRLAIEGCDIVVTSDTSVGHLAAAMGKDTRIIVPVLPYYLWADGKRDSIWYSNVTLFRQKEYGNWGSPLDEVVESVSNPEKRLRLAG